MTLLPIPPRTLAFSREAGLARLHLIAGNRRAAASVLRGLAADIDAIADTIDFEAAVRARGFPGARAAEAG